MTTSIHGARVERAPGERWRAVCDWCAYTGRAVKRANADAALRAHCCSGLHRAAARRAAARGRRGA